MSRSRDPQVIRVYYDQLPIEIRSIVPPDLNYLEIHNRSFKVIPLQVAWDYFIVFLVLVIFFQFFRKRIQNFQVPSQAFSEGSLASGQRPDFLSKPESTPEFVVPKLQTSPGSSQERKEIELQNRSKMVSEFLDRFNNTPEEFPEIENQSGELPIESLFSSTAKSIEFVKSDDPSFPQVRLSIDAEYLFDPDDLKTPSGRKPEEN